MLTISTLASLAAKWLLPRLSTFQENQPGIDVHITTSTSLVDFKKGDVDAAIRYGRGQWPGLRADWLMADQLFPVCSPALLTGTKPLRSPEDLANHVLLHSTNNDDDWRLWLTAAGLPTNLSKQHGVSFDLIFMVVQAAIDGLGVAIGRTSYVQDDIAKGRLVVPFKIALPADAGFYLAPRRQSRFTQTRRIPAMAGCREHKTEISLEFPDSFVCFSGWSHRRGVADVHNKKHLPGACTHAVTAPSEVPQIKSRIGAILRATSGNFLEQFDFFLFGFYASAIAKAFFPAEN